jgi:Na+/proline symporter
MASLGVVDYVIFILMLVVCGAIGIYHAIRGRQEQTTANFLMANHSMGKFPIAMSLLVSFLSAIAILGIPSEVYTFGLSYVLVSFAFIILLLISAFLYVPVFYKLKITSTNEVINFNIHDSLR